MQKIFLASFQQFAIISLTDFLEVRFYAKRDFTGFCGRYRYFFYCVFWAHMQICPGLPCNPSVKEVELFMSSPAYKAELEKRLADCR